MGCATAQSTQTARLLTARLTPAPGAPAVVAFVGVSVLPLDSERVLEDQTVVVRGDRIEAMGPKASTPVPTGATQIDGRGRFLMPGLVDMHIHLQPGDGAPTDPAGQQLSLLLANGITTARALGAPPSGLAASGPRGSRRGVRHPR